MLLYPQGAKQADILLKRTKKCSGLNMRFLLLAVDFFYSGIQRDILTDQIQSREVLYPQGEVLVVSSKKRCFLMEDNI